MKGKVDTAIFDEMENILNKMISLSNKMKTLQENKFSISDITSKVTVIKDILEKLDPLIGILRNLESFHLKLLIKQILLYSG